MNTTSSVLPIPATRPLYRWSSLDLGERIRLGVDESAENGRRHLLAVDSEHGLALLPLDDAIGESGPDGLHRAALSVLAEADPDLARREFWAARARASRAISIESFYEQMTELNIVFGDSFKTVRDIWRGDCEAIGAIRLDGAMRAQTESYFLHPAFLDACLQMFGATLFGEDSRKTFLPVGMESFYFEPGPVSAAWSHVKLRRAVHVEDVEASADFVFYDSHFRKVGEVVGFSLRLSDHGKLMSREVMAVRPEIYLIDWERQEARPDNDLMPSCAIFGCNADADVLRARIGPHTGAGASAAIIVMGAANAEPTPERYNNAVRAVLDDLRNAGLGQMEQRLSRLWFVTRSTQQVTGHDPIRPDSSFVWGLARSIELEYPGAEVACLDLDEDSDVETALIEAALASTETMVAYRAGARYVARLAPMKTGLQLPSGDTGYQLRTRGYGSLDQLYLAPAQAEAPGPDQVQIRVHATGLNFKDVLHALGMLEEGGDQSGVAHADQMVFGGDCAGMVVAVGSQVTSVQPGDRVLATMAFGCFASHVTVAEGLLSRLPEWMSFEEGAATPTAYLTAYHALCNSARTRPGDRVLIHAAAGGVGLAAVQIALRLGAEVYATASPSKHAFLRSIGVRHLANSRSLDFARQFAAEAPQKFDVILNSLNAEFIECSFSLLRDGGRFVEIGKIGAWSPQKVRALRPDAHYTLFDLMDLAKDDPAFIAAELKNVVAFMREHGLRPSRVQHFPIGRVTEAFRCMAEARHIGKIVVGHADERRPEITADRRHIVTGGLGALGQWMVRWLVKRGARCLVVVSRQATSERVERAFADLIQAGIKVSCERADLSVREQTDALFQRLSDAGQPIGDIYHLAGCLADGLLANQTQADFDRVMDAKAQTAAHLHRASLNHRHQRFVVFSSVAGVFGGAGQSNYAAANAQLDALVRHRRALGLHGMTINWGPWVKGMAGDLSATDLARLADSGVTALDEASAEELLDRLFAADASQAVAAQFDWSRVASAYPPGRVPPLIAHLSDRRAGADDHAIHDMRDELAPLDAAGRLDTMVRAMARNLCVVLRLSGDDVLPEHTLQDLGLDSLMGMELRHRLERQIGTAVPVSVLLKGLSVTELSAELLQIAGLGPAGADVSRPSSVSERWLLRIAEGREDSPRLLCFHHLGGSADFFRQWAQPLQGEFEILAVQLPGRGDRADEAAITHVDSMLDALLPQIEALPERPLVLYGHSMGSHLAFEFARRWQARGGKAEHLFASGLWPPLARQAQSHASRFAEHGRAAMEIPSVLRDDPEYLSNLERLIQADAELLRSCTGIVAESAPDLALTVFSGIDDPIAPPDDVDGWRHCTRAAFAHHSYAGKHMFLLEAAGPIHTILRRVAARFSQSVA